MVVYTSHGSWHQEGFDIRISLCSSGMAPRSTSSLWRGSYYRLLTSAFLHGDFTHILFNMYALFALRKNSGGSSWGRGGFCWMYSLSLPWAGGAHEFSLSHLMFLWVHPEPYLVCWEPVMMMALLRQEEIRCEQKNVFQGFFFVLFINLFSGFSASSASTTFGHIGGLLARNCSCRFTILAFYVQVL